MNTKKDMKIIVQKKKVKVEGVARMFLNQVFHTGTLDAGKHALKHLERVMQTLSLPRGLSHSVVNFSNTSCLN